MKENRQKNRPVPGMGNRPVPGMGIARYQGWEPGMGGLHQDGPSPESPGPKACFFGQIATFSAYCRMAMVPLISAQKISKAFGVRPLFSDISLVITEGERVGIVGHNGSGKSTLLRILAQLEEPDQGTLALKKNLHVCYVAQEDRFPEGSTIGEVLRSAVPANEHNPEGRIAQAMGQAGIRDPSTLVAQLSGGQKKRLAIVVGILGEPDLLLLDEPTNHLDIAGVNWLEELIIASNFASVFITHDRYFIQNVAQRVIEIDRRYPGGFFSVDGNYSDFLDSRALFWEQRQQYQQSLANKVRREVDWLRHGPRGRTTKSKSRIDRAGELVSELKSIDYKVRTVGIEFSGSQRKTQDLIRMIDISKSYENKILYEDLTMTLSPGMRLGVVGLNGSGKTTFLQTLTGALEPDQGTIVRAPRLKIAMLDQMRTSLKRDLALQEFFCGVGETLVYQGREYHVSAWARRFLFGHEQLKIPINKLSGGEQARALIARLMMEPADILILDEPTNDLDIATLEVLEESLEEFPGAIVLVTHDRYLLDRVANVVLGLSAISGKRSLIYADYHQWVEATQPSDATPVVNRKEKSQSVSAPDTRKVEGKRKLSHNENRELGSIEDRIAKAESLVEEFENSLQSSDVTGDPQRLAEVCDQLAKAQSDVEHLYARWDELERKARGDET